MNEHAPDRAANPSRSWLVQYRKSLHRYLLRRLRSAEDAEDLAQEVYLRMLRVDENELIHSPQDYLYGIASHVVYQFRLRAHREMVDFDSDSVERAVQNPSQVPPNELAQRIETEQHLEWALNQLPLMQRAVLLLHKRDQLTDREIAQRLNIGISTVKKHLARAHARMRTLWDIKGEDK